MLAFTCPVTQLQSISIVLSVLLFLKHQSNARHRVHCVCCNCVTYEELCIVSRWPSLAA